MYFAISGVKFCFQLIEIRKQPSIVYLCQYLCWKIICSKCQCSTQKVLKIKKIMKMYVILILGVQQLRDSLLRTMPVFLF